MANMKVIREAAERCYIMANTGDYSSCNTYSSIALEDPSSAPNAHFMYILSPGGSAGDAFFRALAFRNTRDGGSGSPADMINCIYSTDGSWYGCFGGGIYQGLRLGAQPTFP